MLTKVLFNVSAVFLVSLSPYFFNRITIENEGTEREAPGPALGICHVHESYFQTIGSLCSSGSPSSETSACRPTSV